MESTPVPKPILIPPLDESFLPAVLENHAFRAAVGAQGVPLVIALERDHAHVSRYQVVVYPEDHPDASANLAFAERVMKFLLWQRGAYKVYIGGPRDIGSHLSKSFSAAGKHQFDYHFMGEQVYGKVLEVISCAPHEVPEAHETGRPLGRHLDGCRLGFDLGASDRKVSAVVEGKTVYSEEVIWEPQKYSDPNYHYREILTALRTAASKMPRLDAVGGSSAGILIDNQPMVASLFRAVPVEMQQEVRNLFLRIGAELGVPLEVINDGDVTALAGSMALGDGGVLGIALGSSQATGYVDLHGDITGWLNELAFAPIDCYSGAPVEEWSGDRGCGASYLSQQAVFRLAPRAGIAIPNDLPAAGKLQFVQDKLEAGHEGSLRIWESIGTYLGYAVAQYADFYEINHVLILGRCTSGQGGELILRRARAVLESEFPSLLSRIQLHLPDEQIRRIGQSVAAASLPVISKTLMRIA